MICRGGAIETGKKRVRIEGMMCQDRARHMKEILERVAGVSSVEVDVEGRAATVTLSGDVGDDALSKAVVDAGHDVTGTDVA